MTTEAENLVAYFEHFVCTMQSSSAGPLALTQTRAALAAALEPLFAREPPCDDTSLLRHANDRIHELSDWAERVRAASGAMDLGDVPGEVEMLHRLSFERAELLFAIIGDGSRIDASRASREKTASALKMIAAWKGIAARCSPDPAPSDSLFRICLALNAEDLDGALKAIARLKLRDEQFARYADMVEAELGVKNFGDVEQRLGVWRENIAAAHDALIDVCNALGMAESKRSWANAVEVVGIRRRGAESQVEELRTELESLRAGNVALAKQRDLDANAIRLLEMNLADADRRADEAEKALVLAQERHEEDLAELRHRDDLAQRLGGMLSVQPNADCILDAVRMLKERVASLLRMDEVQLNAACDAVSIPKGGRSWGELVKILEDTYVVPQWPPPTLPDGYRHDGATVTNGTITVEAPGDVLIIRTSAGIAAWAPLDAVKIAIVQKEKGK